MHPQLLLLAFMTLICGAIASSVSHTPSHSHAASPSSESFSNHRHSTTAIKYTSCSAEHSCIHTTHPAPTAVGSRSYATTVEGSKRKVGVKRPATAVTAPTRYTTVSEDIDTTGILLPVHRIAESPGVGVLGDSVAPHSTVAASGAVGSIETASMLLPVHRVTESPGVGFVSVETSMSAGTKQRKRRTRLR